MLPIEILQEWGHVIRRIEHEEGVVNILSVKDRLEFKRAFVQPNLFMVAQEGICESWAQGGPHRDTVRLSVITFVENEQCILYSRSKK